MDATTDAEIADGALRDAATDGRSDAAGEGVELRSAVEVCVAYYRRLCRRRGECGFSTFGCAEAALECPERMFSKGALATIEAARECVEAWETVDCARVYAGPDCAAEVGSLTAGEPCRFSNQCAGRCDGAPGSCGVCVETLDYGAACERGGTLCPKGSYCTGAYCLGKELPEAGERCESDTECRLPMRCMAGDDSLGYCEVPAATAGQPCAQRYTPEGPAAENDFDGWFCEASHYCDRTGDAPVCALLPGEGEDCQGAFELSVFGNCLPGLQCVLEEGLPTMCRGPGEEGESCHEYVGDVACVEGLECRFGRECRPPISVGERCIETSGDCEDGLFCVPGLPELPRCVDPLGGFSCDDDTYCPEGWACAEGRCSPPTPAIGEDPCDCLLGFALSLGLSASPAPEQQAPGVLSAPALGVP